MDANFPPGLERAIEALMENEALTGDLDDLPAQVLLDWGISNLYAIFSSHAQLPPEQFEEATYGPQRANRKLLRRIGKWISQREALDFSQHVEQFLRVLDSAQTVYGTPIAIENDRRDSFLVENLPAAPAEFIQALRTFIEIS